LKTTSTKINRRQAIGFAAACCGGIGVDPVNAAQRTDPPSNLRRRIRSLHLELLLFNHELVPQFLTDRDEHSADESKRARRFLAVSLYMRRMLDQRGADMPVSIDETKLSGQLRKLNVIESFPRQPQPSRTRPAVDTDWLSTETTETSHSFVTTSQGSHPHRVQQSALELCIALERSVSDQNAVETVRDASDDDIRLALESIAPTKYLQLLEPLFLIRPHTPVSMLAIHSTQSRLPDRFQGLLSAICSNLMERLAHDHFDQTLAIGKLQQSDAKHHPSTLSSVFGVLLDKWRMLVRDEHEFKPKQYSQLNRNSTPAPPIHPRSRSSKPAG
jgi:hypothetical protein